MQALLEIDNNKESGIGLVDVRAKLIITIISSLSTIIISNIWGLLIIFLFSLMYVLSMKKIKVVIFAYIFFAVTALLALFFSMLMNMFMPLTSSTSHPSILIPFMRMAIMMNVVLPLAFTTRIQSMLTALKSFNLAIYIYLPIAVMIRFIPTFINDIKQIVEVAKIRGVKLSPLSFIFRPIFMGRVILIPLLFRSLKTSEELGIAAELKGLGLNNNITPYKNLKWKAIDTIVILTLFVVIISSLIVQFILNIPDQ